MYDFTMSNNPFLSKEVKLKRVWKGFVISFSVLVMVLVIGDYYVNLIDSTLRSHYVEQEQKEVLGAKDSEPKLIGSYGDISSNDTFVWDWDRNWDREGYYKLTKYINNPQYYISTKYFELKQTWDLKNGYKLSLSCTQLDMNKAIPGDVYPCTLSYNKQVLTNSLRYEAYCSDYENLKDCHGSTNFIVYSNIYEDSSANEYIIFSEWALGSKDWIYVYRLNDGKATLLPFNYKGKEENRWYITVSSYEMYGLYSTQENENNFNDPIELVTYFHEPSMGSQSGDNANNVEGVYENWEVSDNKLNLKQRVVDLYKEGEETHWL